jgi:AraC-like DNA-binding protein
VLVNFMAASWVYVLGYYALARPGVLTLSARMNRELEPALEKQPAPIGPDPMRMQNQKRETKPEQEDPGSNRSAEVLAKLSDTMKNQEPYLDEFLTLSSLAKLCGVPAYLLGRVINKELGKNFMTYVNEHRVERAKELLRSAEHKDQRILDIAFSCGFRTKSAFNDSFKKLTGMTPSEFRQKEGKE